MNGTARGIKGASCPEKHPLSSKTISTRLSIAFVEYPTAFTPVKPK
jgi:hypothetical protein